MLATATVPPEGNSTSTISPDTYPFNITDPNDVDCAYLQALYGKVPELFGGSDMMVIEQMCENGEISTAEDVTQAFEEFEGPNPKLDEQIVLMATNICEKTLGHSDDSLTAIQEACAEDPRDDEHIVDLTVIYQAQQSSTDPSEGMFNCAESMSG